MPHDELSMFHQCSHTSESGFGEHIHVVIDLFYVVADLARSVLPLLKRWKFGMSPKFHTNTRARQRTYEAAYWRTEIGQFSFAVIVFSMFQSIFYRIGG